MLAIIFASRSCTNWNDADRLAELQALLGVLERGLDTRPWRIRSAIHATA